MKTKRQFITVAVLVWITVCVNGQNPVYLSSIPLTPNPGTEIIAQDSKLIPSGAWTSSAQSGEGIEKSYDGDMSTLYHSKWSNSNPNYFPITLDYYFENPGQMDYLIYHPRKSGSNGNFHEVELWYQLTEDETFIKHGDFDFEGTNNPFTITFDEPLNNPVCIRFIVKSGSGGFASCAEMEFCRYADHGTNFDIFEDNTCTRLKPGVTMADIVSLSYLPVQRLAIDIFNGNYSTEFRCAEFEPYPTISQTSSWMKTSGYNPFENPTGIYFDEDETMIIIVDNPGNEKIALKIQNFGTQDPAGSQYPLRNGINVITAQNRGLGYVSYYTTNYETAPNVKIHFAMGKENGYFDRGRHTNEDWKRMLANACSDIMDVRGYRCQIAYPTAAFRATSPDNGEIIAEMYDNVIYYEHEIMGLNYYNKVPKNRQFSRVVPSGMFADGIGAGIPVGSINNYIIPSATDFWGLGHELGHVNQIRPGLKWVSTGEVTNNIYSAWVQFMLGNRNNLRLEHENHGGNDDNMNGIGGRFNAYLNNGIRLGENWLCQEGPDFNQQAEFGTPPRRNYDHFVKLCPMWQIQLYFHQAGYSPNIYAKVSEKVRNTDETSFTNGELQLNFMRNVCDFTGQDVTDFFVKCGMLKPINKYLEDYSPGWLTITQEQCDELIAYASKYPKPESPVIYYINGNNWEVYKYKRPMEGTFGNGTQLNGTLVKVNHSVWKNTVAYETYSGNQLVRITMSGRGYRDNSYTDVLYPQGSTRIEAIDWQGNKTLVYGNR